MSTFSLDIDQGLMSIEYDASKPSENDVIVKEITHQLTNLTETGKLTGGELLKINGKQTLPMAFAIAHHVSHLYGAISVFDPKLQQYVVTISHSPKYRLGDCIV